MKNSYKFKSWHNGADETPTKESLIAYYQKHTTREGIKYNADYGVELSLKAVAYIELHVDDGDIADTLRDRRIYYGDPEITFHDIIVYEAMYKMPRVEHVRLCRRCGHAFSYESLIKTPNLNRINELSIPTKCPECSGKY